MKIITYFQTAPKMLREIHEKSKYKYSMVQTLYAYTNYEIPRIHKIMTKIPSIQFGADILRYKQKLTKSFQLTNIGIHGTHKNQQKLFQVT